MGQSGPETVSEEEGENRNECRGSCNDFLVARIRLAGCLKTIKTQGESNFSNSCNFSNNMPE